ncbi:MAG: hypothetical protein LKJ69_07610 [Lactobacillus sp.]|nr:hypothetical protein [Lactobacillus sp.]MCI2033259.1 hypothetical protein [Lactobacillus sp.]
MKKAITFGIGLFAVLSLAACGNTSSKSAASSSVKVKKTIKAGHGTEKKASREVSGPLTKVGTYSNDDDLGKVTLMHIYHPTTAIADGKVSLKISSFKVFKVEPKNSKQQSFWNDSWSTTVSDNPYYYVQSTFEISNKTGQDITLEGFKSLVFDGRAYALGQTNDETSGVSVPNGSTIKDQTVTFPIEKSAIDKTDFGIALDEINDSAQENEVVPVMNSVTVNLSN